MKLIGYEWIKLLKQFPIWLLTVLLLAGNLVLLYASQKNTLEYFFVFQQKDSYIAFCQGDKTVDAMGFYQQELEEQECYIASYKQFIAQMENRAEEMGEAIFYGDENSYLSRNLQKTCQDFSIFADTTVVIDNCFGVRAFAQYNYGTLFLIIFLGLLIWYLLFYERNYNLFLLCKGCKQGHQPLAMAKLVTLLMVGAVYVLCQEGIAILCVGRMYGYGDLSRPVQSVSLFRNCPYILTVGQAIGVTVLIRVGISIVIGGFMFAVGMWIKNEIGAVWVVSIVLGVEYTLNSLLSVSGSMKGLKFINPFFYWCMEQSIGCYLNVNFFGYAVGKDYFAIIGAFFIVVSFGVLGIVAFHRTCQIKSGGYWEQWMLWFRGKCGVMSRRVSLLYYEFYKLLLNQKKGIAVVFLLLWAGCNTVAIFVPQYYASSEEAAYHSYLEKLSGSVTSETLDYLEEEEVRFQQIREQIRSYGVDVTDEDLIKIQLLQLEIERMEEGFQQVQLQLEALSGKPGNLKDKYLLDEVAYLKLWKNTDHEVFLWFAGSVFLLFVYCGIYTVDGSSEMLNLFRSTRKGRKALAQSKDVTALFWMVFVYFIVEMPLFLAYFQVDGFATVGQKLSDLVNRSCSSDITLLAFEGLVFSLKGISFLLAALVSRRLAKMLKQSLPTLLSGGALFGMATLIFIHNDWSLHMILLQLL